MYSKLVRGGEKQVGRLWSDDLVFGILHLSLLDSPNPSTLKLHLSDDELWGPIGRGSPVSPLSLSRTLLFTFGFPTEPPAHHPSNSKTKLRLSLSLPQSPRTQRHNHQPKVGWPLTEALSSRSLSREVCLSSAAQNRIWANEETSS